MTPRGRTTIRFHPTALKKLKATSKDLDRTMTLILDDLILRYLDRYVADLKLNGGKEQ